MSEKAYAEVDNGSITRGEGCWLVVAFFVIVAFAGVLGHAYGEGWTRNAAIEAGAAHWEIDAVTAERRFVWDSCREVEPGEVSE